MLYIIFCVKPNRILSGKILSFSILLNLFCSSSNCDIIFKYNLLVYMRLLTWLASFTNLCRCFLYVLHGLLNWWVDGWMDGLYAAGGKSQWNQLESWKLEAYWSIEAIRKDFNSKEKIDVKLSSLRGRGS